LQARREAWPVILLPGLRVAVGVSRQATKAITVHFPEGVRRQLKAMAGEQGRYIDDMVAEAFNLLFAKYRKAEIPPRKISK
jgi:hypothetical protein